MQERIKTIITRSWTAAVDQTEKSIREIFNENSFSSIGNYQFRMNNLLLRNFFHNFSLYFWFADEKSFWDEETEDNPKSLKNALDVNRQNHRLLMKSKGFSPELCRICNELDKSVESIYNDLNLYVNSTTTESIELRDDPNVRKEQANLVEFLRSCSQNGVSEYLNLFCYLNFK